MPAVIKVHEKNFTSYLSETEIREKITLLAEQLNKDYAGKNPLFISILNGSFIFAADLFKQLSNNPEICFVKIASYKGEKSTGNIITTIGLDTEIKGRNIVILEDIVDTGKTLSGFIPQIHEQQALSVKIATLLHKPDATIYPIQIDYCCFTIPNKFVIGYGLDYDGLGRNLKDIYQLQQE